MADKVISSELVFKGRYLKIHRDEVLLPDGSSSYREYIQHPGAAMVIPVTKAGSLLMVKQYRHAVKDYMWEFPAGKRDHGEPSLQTAERELLEEVGGTTESFRYLTSIFPVIGYADEKIDIYLATQVEVGPNRLDHGEFLTVHEMTMEEAFAKLRRGEIGDVKTQIGLFWLEKIIASGW